jgi:hypothetical protein
LEISPEILIHYLENPEGLNSASNESIRSLIEKYPFFQTARLLQIKNLQQLYQTVDKQFLNLTAAYVTDRKVLYYLLYKLGSTMPVTVDARDIQNKASSFEKEYKDSLKENIADTLNKQLHYYELEAEHEIELIPGLAIDIRKEYGNGIELEDKNFSIGIRKQLVKDEILELTDEPETSFLPDSVSDFISDNISTEEAFEFAGTDLLQEGEFQVQQSDSPNTVQFSVEIDKAESISDDNKESPVAENEILQGGGSELEPPPNRAPIIPPVEKVAGEWGEITAFKSFDEWIELIEQSEIHSEEVSGQTAKEDIKPTQKEGYSKELTIPPGYRLPDDKSEINAESEDVKEKNDSLIDKFIKANPRIIPARSTDINEDISAESVKEHESFFTDTLAQIYINQGNYAKAILAYEKLSLKYPEKSTYFAGQILEIRKRINKS